MAYHLLTAYPEPDQVRYLTFVAFLPSGACVSVPDGRGGLRLPGSPHPPADLGQINAV
jgi:hypothetical protein